MISKKECECVCHTIRHLIKGEAYPRQFDRPFSCEHCRPQEERGCDHVFIKLNDKCSECKFCKLTFCHAQEEMSRSKKFEDFLMNDFDNPPDKQTHRWLFCYDGEKDELFDCACCFIGEKIDFCSCICHKRIEQIKSFLSKTLEHERREIVEKIEGDKYNEENEDIGAEAIANKAYDDKFEAFKYGYNQASEDIKNLIKQRK